MQVVKFFVELTQVVIFTGKPVARLALIPVRSVDERESSIRAVCDFWRQVSLPVEASGVIAFQNAVLTSEIRTQNTDLIRLVHKVKGTDKPVLDVLLMFFYDLEPCSFPQEMAKVYDVEKSLPLSSFEDNKTCIEASPIYSRFEIQHMENPYIRHSYRMEHSSGRDAIATMEIQKTIQDKFAYSTVI